MREIKFRAWDRKRKCMRTDIRALECIDGHIVSIFLDGDHRIDDFELMQFTGLLNKNGEEIWEGDIVKAPHYVGPGLLEKTFIVDFNEKIGSYQWNYWAMEKSEILGNKFEHPHLLEKNDG